MRLEIFLKFSQGFDQQCTTVDNQSSVPENTSFETEKRLSFFEICSDDIVKFIRLLDPNKAYGHDGISIGMLKLCTPSISKPLQILYKNYFDNKYFPQTWEKANLVPIHEKVISN